MKVEIKVPAMGESISEASIGEILKKSGSKVSVDDELLELETDKVNQVIYAPQSGILELKVKSGDHVAIGDVIGSIDTEVQQVVEKQKEEPKKEVVESGARVSKEHAVDELLQKKSKEEIPVQKPVKSEKTTPISTRETRKKMSKIRQVIGERLLEAKQSTAMLTTFNEVDMSAIMSLREKYKDSFQKEFGVKLGFMSFFVKAVVNSLKEFPDFNSYIDGDEIVHREYYDIGIAVGTDRGLVVPVLKNCDFLNCHEIEKEIEVYAKKAKEGGLTLDDLKGGGFTITNGGVYGSLLSTPILNPPQCGILGMHKIMKRAVVINDEITIRPMMYLALSYDHRLIDGKAAVSFLIAIKNCLEDPHRIFL